MKTTKEILKDVHFNYLYPMASIRKITEQEDEKWFSVSDVEQLQKELFLEIGADLKIPSKYLNIISKDIIKVINNFKGK